MKGKLAIGASALIFVITVQAGVFKDETDRFTGLRAITWNSIPSQPKDFALSSYLTIPKQGQQFSQYTLTLTTWAGEWQYIECHSIDWLVDGQSAPYLNAEYSNTATGAVTIERFSAVVSKPDMLKLSSAKLVEFKVCGTEGKVSESDLAGLRKVAGAM